LPNPRIPGKISAKKSLIGVKLSSNAKRLVAQVSHLGMGSRGRLALQPYSEILAAAIDEA
jgi:hypothetical protein